MSVRRISRPVVAYPIAAIIAFAAIGLTALVGYAMENAIYAFAFAGVVLAAWIGGLGPALLAAAISALGVEFFFVPPPYQIAYTGASDLIRILVFIGGSLLIGTITESMRRATARAEIAGAQGARSLAGLRLTAEASAELASSLDYEETLRSVARLAVPRFAEWCAVDLAEGGKLRRVAVEHADPAKVALARELETRYPSDPDAPVGAWAVLRTGETQMLQVTPELIEKSARDVEHLQALRDLRLGSIIIAPLRARRETLGVLSFVREQDSPEFDDDDVALAEDLARRGAIAIENARLMTETEESRMRLEEQAAELEQQTEELQQVMEELEATADDLQRSNDELALQRDAAEAARRSAEEANRTKSQFLATMSHELRTPLNAITGYSELITMGVHGPINDKQRDAIHRIDRNGRHLLGLINSILNFARLEARQVYLHTEPVKVQDLLASLDPLILPQLEAKTLTYEYEPCDPELTVMGDAEKLEQILINLLSNAIKFTPEGGRISLACESDDDVVAIHVSDNGRGIPEDKLDTIFEPFVQIDPRRTVGLEGVGLGLSISRDLARSMDGDIAAVSEADVGSRFTLTLPRVR